jgi:hypothetical protein
MGKLEEFFERRRKDKEKAVKKAEGESFAQLGENIDRINPIMKSIHSVVQKSAKLFAKEGFSCDVRAPRTTHMLTAKSIDPVEIVLADISKKRPGLATTAQRPKTPPKEFIKFAPVPDYSKIQVSMITKEGVEHEEIDLKEFDENLIEEYILKFFTSLNL